MPELSQNTYFFFLLNVLPPSLDSEPLFSPPFPTLMLILCRQGCYRVKQGKDNRKTEKKGTHIEDFAR